jgi:hypothetical protein
MYLPPDTLLIVLSQFELTRLSICQNWGLD